MSFRLAAFVHVDPEWRQDLLEMRDEETRLARLDEVFEQVIARGPGKLEEQCPTDDRASTVHNQVLRVAACQITTAA